MQHTVGIYTLGCKVSQYESIAISEGFSSLGFKVLPFEDKCDVYVINTCTVTAESDRKCRQVIRRAVGRGGLVFVCGCYSQASPEEVSKIDGVHFIGGNYNKTAIPRLALDMLEGNAAASTPVCSIPDIDSCGFERMCIHSAPRTRVYVKIEDGCESNCTYCIIPAARGKIRSKSPENVISEVQGLALSGVKEVVLTGIETASYGKDLDNITLIDIIEKIAEIDGIERIRLGSLDPSSINEDFVLRAARTKKLAPHFHLSVQSGASSVLARMKRKYNARQALDKINMIKRHIPDATFTTDMMVGFPGESEDEFRQSIDFSKQAGFLFMHIFPYSKRKNTPAATYEGQISEAEKHRRVSEMSKVRDEIAKKTVSERMPVGACVEVLFETYCDGYAVGRSANFIEIKAHSERDLHGEIHTVKIMDNQGNMCTGELLSE